MTDIRDLPDDELLEVANRKLDPEIAGQIEILMGYAAEGGDLPPVEVEELAALKEARDQFLRDRTRAIMEARMRGLTLPED